MYLKLIKLIQIYYNSYTRIHFENLERNEKHKSQNWSQENKNLSRPITIREIKMIISGFPPKMPQIQIAL